jgi:hypothetical protein
MLRPLRIEYLLTARGQAFHVCSLKIESKGGKKQALSGGEVSEYIRANTMTQNQDSITITSATTIPKPAGI